MNCVPGVRSYGYDGVHYTYLYIILGIILMGIFGVCLLRLSCGKEKHKFIIRQLISFFKY